MAKKKVKKEEYEKQRFDLSECEVEISIVQNEDNPDFGTAFLNIRLPDKRWIPHCLNVDSRVPYVKNPEL